MKLLDWLEKRIGHLAVPNITVMLIFGQVVVYVAAMSQAFPGLMENVVLVPQLVLEGEVWRLFTFLIDPPDTNPLFAFFAWYLLYWMGTALEAQWGAFRYNVFLSVGFVASLAAAFLTPEKIADDVYSNEYFYASVFLAFARFFPEFVIHVFLILPVKIKWLALLAWIGYGLAFISGGNTEKIMIVAAIANYLLFFWRDHLRQVLDYRRRTTFAAKTNAQARKGPMVHTCVVCGRSSKDEPKTAFRYCSKCAGQMCYCPDHIRNHEHVVNEHASA